MGAPSSLIEKISPACQRETRGREGVSEPFNPKAARAGRPRDDLRRGPSAAAAATDLRRFDREVLPQLLDVADHLALLHRLANLLDPEKGQPRVRVGRRASEHQHARQVSAPPLASTQKALPIRLPLTYLWRRKMPTLSEVTGTMLSVSVSLSMYSMSLSVS